MGVLVPLGVCVETHVMLQNRTSTTHVSLTTNQLPNPTLMGKAIIFQVIKCLVPIPAAPLGIT